VDTDWETCPRCGATLGQDAKFCSQCGFGLTYRGESNHQVSNDRSDFPAPNRLLFRQTSGESLLEASFTDATAQQLADVVRTLVTGKILRPTTVSSITAAETDDGIEPIVATSEAHPRIDAPTQTVHPTVPDTVSGDVARVFSERNGVIRLERRDLKADNAAEYAVRLTRLFLYYVQQQRNVDEVEKQEVYDFLRRTGIKKSDYAPVISRDKTTIEKKKTTFQLNFAGEQKVKAYLRELDGPESEQYWYPGKDVRGPAVRKRRVARRKPDQHEGDEHESLNAEVKQLQEQVKARHKDVVKWRSGQLALLGLYALRKQYGDGYDATYQKVAQFLYSTFELSVHSDSLRRALDRLKASKEGNVNPGQNSGYRISPTGVERVEEMLKTKQPVLEFLDAGENTGSSGASQA
jgi:flagellar motility protein MotE (MotC chaperone)